jgi:PIN domain nuclease of toxin-antitoxin system
MTSPTIRIEPIYVIDTHALIWYLLNDPKLGSAAKSVFQSAEQHQTLLVVSAIVLAEFYFANAKNKWFPDFAKVYSDLIGKPFLQFVSFDHTHVIDFVLDASIPEMHDRIIAGIARRLNAPLITSDPQIIASGVATTVW